MPIGKFDNYWYLREPQRLILEIPTVACTKDLSFLYEYAKGALDSLWPANQLCTFSKTLSRLLWTIYFKWQKGTSSISAVLIKGHEPKLHKIKMCCVQKDVKCFQLFLSTFWVSLWPRKDWSTLEGFTRRQRETWLHTTDNWLFTS